MTKSRFILTFGVLSWGLPCGLLFAWWMSSSRGTSFWLWLSLSLPLWCLGGYACGHILWRRMRERDLVEASQHGAAADDRPQAGDRG
jgi:uncharacterized membrane protein